MRSRAPLQTQKAMASKTRGFKKQVAGSQGTGEATGRMLGGGGGRVVHPPVIGAAPPQATGVATDQRRESKKGQ